MGCPGDLYHGEYPVDMTPSEAALELLHRAKPFKPSNLDAVERLADVLGQYPCRCADHPAIDLLRRREAARAVLAAMGEK